jgi:hypothetical protein
MGESHVLQQEQGEAHLTRCPHHCGLPQGKQIDGGAPWPQY